MLGIWGISVTSNCVRKSTWSSGTSKIAYSDAGTALEGGALGWRKAGQLPSFAADRIPTMQPGDVTEPIRSPSGLHLFKLLEVRGAQPTAMVSQVRERHILLTTNEIEDDDTVRNLEETFNARVLPESIHPE